MARAAIIPDVADQTATRGTRGRGRVPKTESQQQQQQQQQSQPAKRGRKPGVKNAASTATATATTTKKTAVSRPMTGIEPEDESTDDEIGMDVARAKPVQKKPAVSRDKGGRLAKSTVSSAYIERDERSDDEGKEEEEDYDDDDDELAQLGMPTKKVGRPRIKTTTTASKTEKTKAEPATTKPTRGRPKLVKESEPATGTTITKRPRGRPAIKHDEKKIYVATNSSFAKSRPFGEQPVVRKKVTFADLAESEDEMTEAVKPSKTATVKKQTKASEPAAGLKARPVRKGAGRGRPAKTQPVAKPLSPKKATQLAKVSPSASSGDEDELASRKIDYSLVVRSPAKNQSQHQQQPQPGLNSPVKRINFTGSTTPSKPTARLENDENSVPGVQPPSALREPAFLGSPARRPPPSATKETFKETPRRGPLFASQLAATSIPPTEASMPLSLKISPKKGANFAASFLASPEKSHSTPFNAKLSLLKSPAKRIQSPFVFQKVKAPLKVDEDVNMEDHTTASDIRLPESAEQVGDSSDNNVVFEIQPTQPTEPSDDVFVDQPVEMVDEQPDIYIDQEDPQHVEEIADYDIRDYEEDKENTEPVTLHETVGFKEFAQQQLHDNEPDEGMQEEDEAMDVGQEGSHDNAENPDQNQPPEDDQVEESNENTPDDDHMGDDGDDAASNPDDNSKEKAESEEESESEKPEEKEEEEAQQQPTETHEREPVEQEPVNKRHSIQPDEQIDASKEDSEDDKMHREHEDEEKPVPELTASSPAVSLATPIRRSTRFQPDEIDEPQSANATPTAVPPAAPTPPANPSHMHALMFSYRDNQEDASSVYDPSPMRRRSRISSRESIVPQTPSTSTSTELGFSPLAAQLSQWKASSPEKTRADRPQRSIFSPVIPNQLKMKPRPSGNRYSQIQTMRHSLAARHSLAKSISMDDNEPDTVEIKKEEQPSELSSATAQASTPEADQGKSSPAKPAAARPSMSITPIRVIRDANRTIHTVSKVPLKPEGDISPIKFPRKRARTMSMDMELPIRGSPNRPKLAPKSRMQRSPSPQKERTPLREIEPDRCEDDRRRDQPVAAASPTKTPRATSSKAEQQVLRGAVVFVDVHTTEGEDASGIFVELLTQMGAKCVKNWSWNGRSSQSPVDGAEPTSSKVGITHVVYKDGGVRTMEKVRQARNLVKCVGVGWVLDCERENKWLDESRYNVDSTIIPRGGAKRRKSMQPRALANVNGCLLSSSASSRLSRNSTEWEGTVESFKRMSPQPSTPPPATGESFLSKIPEVPSTPTPGKGESPYAFKFDFSAMSPATPYFLSQPSRLVQQTCPPKQTNQGLFAAASSESQDPRMNRDLRAKLEAARRKSLAFKPRLESPLSQS